MKKVFLLMLVTMMTATMSYAQNTLVAILSHDTNVQMFYGPSALVNAVKAAVSGDVIALSSGTFEVPEITKGITIRGAGATGDNMTYLKDKGSGYTINIPEDDTNSFTLEGLYIPYITYISGASKGFMAKCITGKIEFNANSSANLKMVNCDVNTLSLYGSSSVKLSNCKVHNLGTDASSTSKADVFNCYVSQAHQNIYANRCSFVNCIFINTYWGSCYIPNDALAMNCLFIQNYSGDRGIDCYYAEVPEVFVSYENILTDARYDYRVDIPTSLQLLEEAKTKYLGTDGKEVGVYGGQYPYDMTPNYPLITKLNVAKQATADNKLSVEIEVSASE